MCRRVNCDRCGKPTFAGCGAHIEQVLADVPKVQRCHCLEDASAGKVEQAQEPPKSRLWPF
jgi:hypothetical protein